MTKLYLYAIEGDCSARGICDWASILPLKNDEEVELAKAYIRNNMEMIDDSKHDTVAELDDALRDGALRS